MTNIGRKSAKPIKPELIPVAGSAATE